MTDYCIARAAARNDDPSELKKALGAKERNGENKVPIDLQYNGYTLLHIAAMCGSQKCLKTLLDAGADPNRWDMTGVRPVYYLCIGKFGANQAKEMINLFAKNGAILDDIILDYPNTGIRHAMIAAGNDTLVDAVKDIRRSTDRFAHLR